MEEIALRGAKWSVHFTKYCAGDKMEKNEMRKECGAYGLGQRVYRVLVGKQEGRRPLGRPRRRWVDNIRMDLQEVGCGYMVWIGLAQDRDRWRMIVSVLMNLRVPWNAGNFLTRCKRFSFTRRILYHGISKYDGLNIDLVFLKHSCNVERLIEHVRQIVAWKVSGLKEI